jgi:GH35 family endo-1,4-beta-xylanase
MRVFLLLIFTVFFFSSNAQDLYHQDLVNYLKDNFDVENPKFLLFDNEQENINQAYIYGNVSTQTTEVTNSNYTLVENFKITSPGNNAWDAGKGIRNRTNIVQGDIVLISFWARSISPTSQVYLFGEDGSTFEKEVYNILSFTPDWSQYFVVFKSANSYSTEGFALGFHLSAQGQEVEIAGLTSLNYGSEYSVSDFPSSFSAANYEGSEEDAAWRALAQARINTIRKADLMVKIVNQDGDPVEGAEVKVEMQEHEFGFGSAYVSCRFPGNDCYNPTYVSKLLDLDGKGHTFNVGVTENALKWDAWEEEWLGSPEETVDAIRWLDNNGIKMRGHTLFWTGYQYMPDDISDNRADLDYVRQRLIDRVESMITHPVLSELVTEWDILNEITQNRDLENIFNADSNLSNGREIYQEIFDKVSTLQPEHINYVNDYVVLSGGGSSNFVINRYKEYLTELEESGVKFDGIGFQCHIGNQPTSILKVQAVLDEFYQRYNKRMKITEYDINPLVDEGIQAKYLEDFLTMIFSHPGVDAFIMWGFWDGNHWKDNAPLFYEDWSLKPSGTAFFNKVFDEWWTEEQGVSDDAGTIIFDAYKGKHKVTVTLGDIVIEQEVNLSQDETIEILMDGLNSTDDLEENMFSISPNPIQNNQLTIYYGDEYSDLDFIIYNLEGKICQNLAKVASGKPVNISVRSGIYILSSENNGARYTQKIIIP